MPWTIIIFIAILVMVEAVADAAKDIIAVEAKWNTSIFKKWSYESAFWLWWTGPEHWKNKYKYRQPSKGRAFIGSTTWMVWITDGWHFAKAVSLNCYRLMVAIPMGYVLPFETLITVPATYIILYLVRGPVFELFYTKILRHE